MYNIFYKYIDEMRYKQYYDTSNYNYRWMNNFLMALNYV